MDRIKEIISELDDSIFKTPVSVDEDYLYYENLKEKYEEILRKFNGIEDEKFFQELNSIKENVLDAIQNYYSGELEQACEHIEKIVTEFVEDDLIVDDVNSHFIFKWIAEEQKIHKGNNGKPIDLYKARIAEGIDSFDAEDMIHIPFKKRGLVPTQRFSIAGVPCMYLATSSYCCWKELGMPPDNMFNVSHVTLEKLRLFNLAVNLRFLKAAIIKNVDFSECSITLNEFLKDYFKLWMLNFACSYIVKEEGRAFKSEYIVPQLVMLALKKNNIDGVVHCSRKIEETVSNLWANPKNLNVAIIGKYEKEKGDDIFLKDYISITNSVNYNEFKQLNLKGMSPKYNKNLDWLPNQINFIQLAGDTYSYSNTDFYYFEAYIKFLAQKKMKGERECQN